MHDYDTDYRRLKAAGQQGWAGSQHERNLARLAETLARLERARFPEPPAKVLELGCGNGMTWSYEMARRGYDVHGIDISEAAITWARETFAESGLAGSFRRGSVCEMPWFAEKSFDVVIDGACLHCLIGNERTRCLQEVRRILRPAGIFVVSSMCGLPKSDDAQASFAKGRPALPHAEAAGRSGARADGCRVRRAGHQCQRQSMVGSRHHDLPEFLFPSPACGGGCRAQRGGWGSLPRLNLLRGPHPGPPPQAGEGEERMQRAKRKRPAKRRPSEPDDGERWLRPQR